MAEKKIQTRGALPPTGVPGAPDTEVTDLYRVACDGGGTFGHPRVWLSIPEDRGWVECGYCDKRFVHADHVAPDTGGDDRAGSNAPDLPGRQGEGNHPGTPE